MNVSFIGVMKYRYKVGPHTLTRLSDNFSIGHGVLYLLERFLTLFNVRHL